MNKTNVKTKDKFDSPNSIRIGIVTVSSTRDLADDESGNMIKDIAKYHKIIRHNVVPEKKALIQNEVRDLVISTMHPVDAIIVNGGTGMMRADSSIEAVRPLFEKEFSGFSTLFMMLNYQKVGSPTYIERATAGVYRGKIIYVLPGNPEACKLAMEKLIMPELPDIVNRLSQEWKD